MGKPDRIRYAALAGGALYALLAAFGFQAEHYGESFPLPALLAASLLFPLFALLLDHLFRAILVPCPWLDLLWGHILFIPLKIQ